MKEPIAEVKIACGRLYLSVAGLALAMESDLCRDVHMAEIANENDFVEDRDGYLHICWTKRLLEEAAKRINDEAKC